MLATYVVSPSLVHATRLDTRAIDAPTEIKATENMPMRESTSALINMWLDTVGSQWAYTFFAVLCEAARV